MLGQVGVLNPPRCAVCGGDRQYPSAEGAPYQLPQQDEVAGHETEKRALAEKGRIQGQEDQEAAADYRDDHPPGVHDGSWDRQ